MIQYFPQCAGSLLYCASKWKGKKKLICFLIRILITKLSTIVFFVNWIQTIRLLCSRVNLEEHEWAPTLNKTSHLSAPHNDTVNLPSLDLEGNPLLQNGTQADNSHMTHNFFGFPLDRQWCIYIFSAITAAMVIATLVRSASFVQLCTNASMNLHNNMFSAIVRSTMYFFNSNPSGSWLSWS